MSHNRQHWTPRILHVTSALDPGGIETWLLRLAQHCGDARLMTAILVLGSHDGLLAPQFRELGVRIERIPAEGGWLRFLWRMDEFLRREGPWDVVHSHVHRRSALVQMAAVRHGVPLRISHSHNSAGQDVHCGWWWRGAARWTASAAIHLLSHQHVACCTLAAGALFGVGNGKLTAGGTVPCHIVPYGMDLEAFQQAAGVAGGEMPARLPGGRGEDLRQSVGIPRDALVMGHVGRFMPQKNHGYLLRLAAEAIRRDARLHFLLVGDGPLRGEMEALAQSLGVGGHIHFAGHRLDVPALMCHVMDAFVFPSLWEGLPVALLEAQAAGLPCFYSSRITPDANLYPESNCSFSLEVDPGQAADSLAAFLDQQGRVGRRPYPLRLPPALRIEHNADVLSALYAGVMPAAGLPGEVYRDEQPA